MVRKHAPAALRNRDPILAVLKRILPEEGTVLEIAAGTGQHAIYFAPELAPRIWLPSDPDSENVASIDDWRGETPCDALRSPIAIDVTEPVWPVETRPVQPPVTAIVAINLIHIAPWAATEGLMAGAERILPAGGVLYLYGPYMREGAHTAPSNAAFDEQLKAQNPDWGVRDLAEVTACAAAHGLAPLLTEEMPANNLSVAFRREQAG